MYVTSQVARLQKAIIRIIGAAFLVAACSSPSLAQSPSACTQPAGPIHETTATLNGMAASKGQGTLAWFEWGKKGELNYSTTPTNVIGNGRVVRVRAAVDGLTSGDVYNYRLVASNEFGIVFGGKKLLTTGMRLSRWAEAGKVLSEVVPPGLSNVVSVACGHGHSLALKNDGTVAAWTDPISYGNNGQTNVPAGLSNVVAIAGGYNHSLALKEDGTLVAWGKDMGGQPVPVPAGLSNVIAVACGDSHSLALKADGTVVAWGHNPEAQRVPLKLTNVVAIAAGSGHSVALTADGLVVNWGYSWVDTTPPRSLSNVVAISAESWHNMALKNDGTVVAWGWNQFGQTNVPVGLSNIVAIAAGWEFSLALKEDGTLAGWGNQAYLTNLPNGFSNVTAIASGDYHSLSLTPENLPPTIQSPRLTVLPNTPFVTLTLFGKDGNGDILTTRIASLPTQGTLYQFTTNGPGDPITTAPMPVSDPLHRVLFAPEPSATGAPYSTFNFLLNDGIIDSPLGTAAITVLPAPTIIPLAFINTGTNQGFAFTFSSLPNATFSARISDNGVSWPSVLRCTEISPGQFFFIDTISTNANQRFYQVRSPF